MKIELKFSTGRVIELTIDELKELLNEIPYFRVPYYGNPYYGQNPIWYSTESGEGVQK